MAEPVSIAIFAKAPVAGFAKTRLIPVLGPEGAATLAGRLTSRAVAEACAADLGPVTLWCAPDAGHPLFHALAAGNPLRLAAQHGADIGARMAHAFVATTGPLILFGADCPSIDAARLRAVARAMPNTDLIIDPALDGGYGLIAGRALPSALFEGVPWSTAGVMPSTRVRAAALGMRLFEGPALRDLDTPDDLAFWSECMPALVDGSQ